jgi:hypothetical protein
MAGFIEHTWIYNGRSADPGMEAFIERMAKRHHYKLQVDDQIACIRATPSFHFVRERGIRLAS